MPSNKNPDGHHDIHSGDVKYHLGTSFTREYPNGKKNSQWKFWQTLLILSASTQLLWEESELKIISRTQLDAVPQIEERSYHS